MNPGPTAFTDDCMHTQASPVETLARETVAWLCPDCDEQLPANWQPSRLPPFVPDPRLTSRVRE